MYEKRIVKPDIYRSAADEQAQNGGRAPRVEEKEKIKENRRKAVGAEGDRDSHRRTECRKRTRRDGREAPAEGGGSDESTEEELRSNRKEREATEAEGTEG